MAAADYSNQKKLTADLKLRVLFHWVINLNCVLIYKLHIYWRQLSLKTSTRSSCCSLGVYEEPILNHFFSNEALKKKKSLRWININCGGWNLSNKLINHPEFIIVWRQTVKQLEFWKLSEQTGLITNWFNLSVFSQIKLWSLKPLHCKHQWTRTEQNSSADPTADQSWRKTTSRSLFKEGNRKLTVGTKLNMEMFLPSWTRTRLITGTGHLLSMRHFFTERAQRCLFSPSLQSRNIQHSNNHRAGLHEAFRS